jgi:hypothetical protein
MLSVGPATDHTGAAMYLAGKSSHSSGRWAPRLLSGFFALTVMFTQPMSN